VVVEVVQVFYGLVFKEGDRILASVAEYATNYIAFLQVDLTHNAPRRSSCRAYCMRTRSVAASGPLFHAATTLMRHLCRYHLRQASSDAVPGR